MNASWVKREWVRRCRRGAAGGLDRRRGAKAYVNAMTQSNHRISCLVLALAESFIHPQAQAQRVWTTPPQKRYHALAKHSPAHPFR